MINQQPPARLLRAARRLPRDANRSPRDEQRISDAHREILRGYRAIAASGQEPGKGWRAAALKALSYLGGDADRHYVTLRDYDHRRYGPFLGVSDDGEAASVVRRAAWASPKARALRGRASPLTIGVGLDAERLGGIGEVVVGPARIHRHLVRLHRSHPDDEPRRQPSQRAALSPSPARDHRTRPRRRRIGRGPQGTR